MRPGGGPPATMDKYVCNVINVLCICVCVCVQVYVHISMCVVDLSVTLQDQ